LKAIPDSAEVYSNFARGNRLLILTGDGYVRIVPLDDPEKVIIVGRFNGPIEGAINEDDEGMKFLVFQTPTSLGKGMPATGPYQLWRVDRAEGRKWELKGPRGSLTTAVFPADRALSPDSRYLVVKCLNTSLARATPMLYVIDLQTEKFTPIQSHNPELMFTCWSKSRDGFEEIVLCREDPNAWDNRPYGPLYVADPKTGAVTDMPSPPLPTPEQMISPDGRFQLVVHEHDALDVVELATHGVRSFTFREEDREFVEDGSFTWLDSRYVVRGMSFIDITSMKQGDLPKLGTKSEPNAFEFSPDFKWAACNTFWTNHDRILVGHVIVPAPQGTHSP
jgi:hypothetical protein